MSLFRRTIQQGYQALGLEAQRMRRQAEIIRLSEDRERRRDRIAEGIGLITPTAQRVDAPPPDLVDGEADRIRAAFDPSARAAGFERWCAEQYELQEARRRGGV